MICPNCGKEIPEGHMYCDNCGTEINFVPDFEPEVENEINEEWHNTSKFNVFKRLDLFLRR